MPEPEIETPIETEVTVEEVRDPAAVLRKNAQLLSDLRAAKERSAQLEDLARDLGVPDDALADPRAHVAKRAEERAASETRTARVREAALLAIAKDQRVPKGDLEELLSRVVSDTNVKIEDGKVTGLEAALSKLAPKRAAPGPPDTRKRAEDVKPIGSWEELQALGYNAVSRFASERPDKYAALRADFERRLAKPERRG